MPFDLLLFPEIEQFPSVKTRLKVILVCDAPEEVDQYGHGRLLATMVIGAVQQSVWKCREARQMSLFAFNSNGFEVDYVKKGLHT